MLIKIYTSGWPKNQNKCWYRIGSPPPTGSKKVVLKFRSVSNIVIAPARTGSDKSSKTAVIKTDHTNKGVSISDITPVRIFKIVVIKLIAPKILETPAKCREKILKSTEDEAWDKLPDRGG